MTEILRNEISQFYESAKCLKWNLDFMGKIEGRYNIPTHSTHGSMTLTILLFLSYHGRGSSNGWNYIWVSMTEVHQMTETYLCKWYLIIYMTYVESIYLITLKEETFAISRFVKITKVWPREKFWNVQFAKVNSRKKTPFLSIFLSWIELSFLDIFAVI